MNSEQELAERDAADVRAETDNYRVYEVAGAPHCLYVWCDVQPIDTAQYMRALFIAGHEWLTQGIEPPPTLWLQLAADGSITRDDNGNAIGGIRPPELQVGRGTYNVEHAPLRYQEWKFWTDLQCVPLEDGSERFPNHGSYVSPYAQATVDLATERYLLWEDVDALIGAAAESEVGKPDACE